MSQTDSTWSVCRKKSSVYVIIYGAVYDRILSPQWIFDRCIEETSILLVLLLVDCGLNALIFIVSRDEKTANSVAPAHVLRRVAGYLMMVVIGLLSFRAVMFMPEVLVPSKVTSLIRSTRKIIAIIWAGVGTLALWKLYHRIYRIKRKLLTAGAAVIFGAIYFVPVSILFVLSKGQTTCSASGQFWPAIMAAHPIHGQLKIDVMEGKKLPKDHNEFVSRVDSALYETIRKNAKTLYLYDASTNTFTWFVRPSRYYVVVFDSRQDYKLYRLSTVHSFINEKVTPLPYFPPSYEGPWDQLPQ